MTVDDVVEMLHNAKDAALVGPRLVQELKDQERADTLTLDALLDIQGQIDEAMAQLTDHAHESDRIMRRCLKIPPSPSKKVPLGL